MPDEARADVHDKLMAVLKRRAYLQPSYEIYGGVAGFYDYGPLGAELKRNLEDLWRRFFVFREGMAEIQCPTISPEQVFRASGHLEKFADTVVECPACGSGNRGDHLVKGEWKRIGEAARAAAEKAGAASLVSKLDLRIEAIRTSADQDPNPENIAALLRGTSPLVAPLELVADGVEVALDASGIVVRKGGKSVATARLGCPACAQPLDAAKASIDAFNLMFRTNVGPGRGRVGYLRPETAQGMFMDFDWLYRHFRESLPFGAVQLGKAYRNEISPRQSLLRLREFHQMEAEVFFDPQNKTWPRWRRAKDRVLTLVPRDAPDTTVKMTIGDAVAKGVVANEALGYFLALTAEFLVAAGIPEENLRFRQHLATEKAHYSTDTWDAEFLSPRFGWVEIVGIADRTDYDLKAHERVSGKELRAFRPYDAPREAEFLRVFGDPGKLGPKFKGKAGKIIEALKKLTPSTTDLAEATVEVDGETITLTKEFFSVRLVKETSTGESFVPHVVEPSFGIDRIFYAVLEGSYMEKEWAVLRLPPRVAPVKVGVFPLMAKDGLDDVARILDDDLRAAGILSQYDEGGSIGKRYARADEVGTPWCVTVDYDTKENSTVTIRSRDTAEQVRVPVSEVVAWFRTRLA